MNNIKIERIKHGLTQEQLSSITEIPVRTIQNWESGIRKCPSYVEKMILDKLNQPDYKTILEEILDMLKGDVRYLKGDDAKQYVNNVIDEIEDSLK